MAMMARLMMTIQSRVCALRCPLYTRKPNANASIRYISVCYHILWWVGFAFIWLSPCRWFGVNAYFVQCVGLCTIEIVCDCVFRPLEYRGEMWKYFWLNGWLFGWTGKSWIEKSVERVFFLISLAGRLYMSTRSFSSVNNNLKVIYRVMHMAGPYFEYRQQANINK